MKDFLHHLFLPKVTNNYRPRVLHHKSLLVIILFIFSAGFLTSFVRTNYPSVLGVSSDISNQQLLILTNQQRQQNGLGSLTDNPELDAAAANKASDMFSKDYWAHISPTGTTPWVFIKSAGYNYIYAGENLAKGFNSAPDVINAWMASPEHRANVLSPNYQNVGFAVATGRLNGEDTVLVVEMLGSTNFVPAPVAKEQPTAQVAVASGSQTVKSEAQPQVSPEPSPVVKKPNPVSLTNLLAASSVNSNNKPLIDSATFSTFSAQAILSLFILILVLDMMVIERRKIVRFVGHNLDHVLFLGLIFVLLLILAKGVII